MKEDGRNTIRKRPLSIEQFAADMYRFPIIMGKAQDEERTGGTNNVQMGYERLKQAYPEKALLLHFNGRNRRVEYEATGGQFYPGHWVYQLPSPCMNAIAATDEVTAIQLEDVSPYINAKGKLIPKMEFCLYAVEDGRRDFAQGEYVFAVGVDVATNTLMVSRAEHGSTPRAFSAGKVELARALTHAGRWHYNYSPICPKDKLGRNCNEALIDELATLFESDGALKHFDGIIFDAATVDAPNTAFDGQVDLDMDGVVDPSGFIDGVYQPLVGYAEFSRQLRERMGDGFLILGDSRTPGHHRSFVYYNGIESEGWPAKKDLLYAKQWSTGIARHQFVDSHLAKPSLHHFHAQIDQPNLKRLFQVAAASLGAGFTTKYHSLIGTDEVVGYTDEMCRGTALDFSGWLGKPIGEMVRLADAASDNLMDPQLSNLSFTPSSAVTETDITGLPTSVLRIEDIQNPGNELYFKVKLKADPLKGYPDVIPRVCWMTVTARGQPRQRHERVLLKELEKSPCANTQELYVDQDGESYGVYFRWLNTDQVDLEFNIEGHEIAVLESIEAYKAPDVIYREFENGIVIGNPSLNEVVFDLKQHFPGQSFRKMNGYIDPIYNDGAVIGPKLALPALDGIFLERTYDESI
ncbi:MULTISPECIES: hypothetical protein [unclassified Lentimonas]|uniref:hypothetical protein n=1 Tax=unclassified Lentimonas TaxID=2630993 RepID=UPI00138A3B77|nr:MULTISPECIES: hypothetical protein [unclassified Lentimonas]